MIIKAQTKNFIEVIYIYKSCIPGMNRNGLYNWNTAYPDPEKVESDIRKGDLFLYQHHHTSLAAVCLNTEAPGGYNQMSWKYDGPCLYVHRLAVHPHWRNITIAERIMDFAYKYAKERKFKSIRLDAITKNAAAIRLYEKCGYEPVGNIHFDYQKDPFKCMELKVY